MITNRALSWLALAMMALPVIPGAVLCWRAPRMAPLWALCALLLPAMVLGARLTGWALRKTRMGALLTGLDTAEARARASRARVLAGGFAFLGLSTSLAVVLRLIDPRTEYAIFVRPVNVLAGLFLVVTGNQLPKMLTRLADTPCDPAAIQAMRRTNGWVMVLAGLTLAVLYLALPPHLAMPAGAAVALAMTLVMLRVRFAFLARQARAPPQQSGAG